jgi:hypothetical protein
LFVSIQHHGHLVLAVKRRIQALAAVARRTRFSPFDYFLARIMSLEKSHIGLARLARRLQLFRQARCEALCQQPLLKFMELRP